MVEDIPDQTQIWDEKFERRDYFGRDPSPFAIKVMPYAKRLDVKDILELGCGQGRDTIYFAKNGFNLTAVDLSRKAIEDLEQKSIALKATGTIEARVMDMRNPLNFGRFFDMAYSNLALHYFDDESTRQIFHNIYGVLRPKGILAFEVKSVNDVDYGKGDKIGDNFFDKDNHVRHFFSDSYIEELLRKFRIIYKEEVQYVSEGKLSTFWDVIAIKEVKT